MRWIVIKDGSTIHMLPEKSVTITVHKDSKGNKSYLLISPPLQNMKSAEIPMIYDTFEKATAAIEQM